MTSESTDRFSKAKALAASGKTEQAEKLLRQIVESSPRRVHPLLLLADLRRKAGAPDEAVSLLRQFWTNSPQPAVGMRLARLLIATRQLEEAEAVLRQLLDLSPADAELRLHLVGLRRRQRDLADVDVLLEQGWSLTPGDPLIGHALAERLLAKKQWPEAEAILRQALENAPEHAEMLANLADLRRRQGDLAEAEALLRRGWTAQPANAAIALELGRLLIRSKQTEEAGTILRQGLQAAPGEIELRLQLADLQRRQGEIAEAETLLRQGIVQNPETIAPVLALSRLLTLDGRAEQAETILNEAIKAFPENPELLVALGLMHAAGGRDEAAITFFEQAVATPDSPAEAWIQLARISGRWTSARQALETLVRALSARKDDPAIHFALGSHLQLMGYITEAEQLVAAAVGRFSGDAPLKSLHVKLHIMAGRYDDARATVADMPAKTRQEQRLKAQMEASVLKAQWRVNEALDIYRQPDMPELDGQEYRLLAEIQLMALDVAGARQSIGNAHQRIRRLRGVNVSQGLTGEIVNDFWTDPQALAAGQTARVQGSLRNWVATVNANRHHTGCALGFLIHLRETGLLDAKPTRPGHQPIPRHIHQFWDTPELPDDVAALMGSWRGRNPEWGYTRHTLASAREWLRQHPDDRLLRAFRHMPAIAGKADLLRLAILHAEGGVYADADDRCLAPLDTFLAGHEMVLRQEHYGTIGNNFLAARPRHPLIGQALDEAVTAVLRGDRESIWLSSGPGLVTRVLASYLVDDPRRLATLGNDIMVLDQPDMVRFCASGCRASYKSSERYWMAGEFSKLPQFVRGRPATTPAASSV
ncbi:tetratricopeptide repeat protein [Ancylobacter sp. Lp-2]|uniref:tetratricopeptide repeat protein n=1 Tax=Ancylobacter sp. Lp-2 TaxID=2881339 RepID=UPI001E5B0D30|nr:tetratricopeptide repeat protein [Ancylobacter sp. Lp-2]MCB4769282.1 tetratricopeptide repeat protein [Ancylobacter sp. Lp-2]